MTCAHCTSAGDVFGSKTARRELARYRKRGPGGTTARILDQLAALGVRPRTHLDIGAGVGALYHETLTSGARAAVHVDAAPDYIDAAREEAERRGHGDRVEYHVGDFVDLADELDDADLVTMDRVICCYPDVRALVAASAAKARTAYSVSYLRDRWWVRLGAMLGNLFLTLRRSEFRVFLHSRKEVDDVTSEMGLRSVDRHDSFLWHTSTYLRTT